VRLRSKLERWGIAAVIVIAAAVPAAGCRGALSRLWADGYKDSPDSTYIAVAVVCGVMVVGMIVFAIAIVRGHLWRD